MYRFQAWVNEALEMWKCNWAACQQATFLLLPDCSVTRMVFRIFCVCVCVCVQDVPTQVCVLVALASQLVNPTASRARSTRRAEQSTKSREEHKEQSRAQREMQSTKSRAEHKEQSRAQGEMQSTKCRAEHKEQSRAQREEQGTKSREICWLYAM